MDHNGLKSFTTIRASIQFACAKSEQTDHSLSFLPEEILDPWLPIGHQLKTLIRLHGCAG